MNRAPDAIEPAVGWRVWDVVPLDGFHWEYVEAIFGMTAAAVICFQAADIYQIQVFRGRLRQIRLRELYPRVPARAARFDPFNYSGLIS